MWLLDEYDPTTFEVVNALLHCWLELAIPEILECVIGKNEVHSALGKLDLIKTGYAFELWKLVIIEIWLRLQL